MSYVTNFLSNTTDIGTIFAPAFGSTPWITQTVASTIDYPNSTYDSTKGVTVPNTGFYLITFIVSFDNTHEKTTSGNYGLVTDSNVICQFPAFFGASKKANGPYYTTSYVYLVANISYIFQFTWFGSDNPETITYSAFINTYPPLLT
jgi:hypothetical protein